MAALVTKPGQPPACKAAGSTLTRLEAPGPKHARLPLSHREGVRLVPRSGDVIRVTREASVQFASPLLFRVIRVHDWSTYDGWAWLDGYELNPAGEAIDRRSIFVQVSGLAASPTSWLAIRHAPIADPPWHGEPPESATADRPHRPPPAVLLSRLHGSRALPRARTHRIVNTYGFGNTRLRGPDPDFGVGAVPWRQFWWAASGSPCSAALPASCWCWSLRRRAPTIRQRCRRWPAPRAMLRHRIRRRAGPSPRPNLRNRRRPRRLPRRSMCWAPS